MNIEVRETNTQSLLTFFNYKLPQRKSSRCIFLVSNQYGKYQLALFFFNFQTAFLLSFFFSLLFLPLPISSTQNLTLRYGLNYNVSLQLNDLPAFPVRMLSNRYVRTNLNLCGYFALSLTSDTVTTSSLPSFSLSFSSLLLYLCCSLCHLYLLSLYFWSF